MPDQAMTLNKDFSQETSRLLQEIDSKINFSSPLECIQSLFQLEKTARHAGDSASTTQLLVKVAEIAFKSQDPSFIQEQLIAASKKREQFKSAIVKMVQRAIELAAQHPDPIASMKAIIQLTEGKIYLEVERARVTKLLASMLFQSGQMKEALEYMLELPVETFGSMEKLEKVEILIDQLKLALSNGEFSKASIIIKKISPQTFQDPTFAALRSEYFSIKKQLDTFNDAFLDVVADCLEIATNSPPSPNALSIPERVNLLMEAVFFALLAPFDCKQQELLCTLKGQKELIEHSPKTVQLIECFCNQNMIPFQDWIRDYQEFLLQFQSVFSLAEPKGKKRWDSICDKLIEHNLRIIAKYYREVSISRLVELLKCNAEKVEELLCGLVVQKAIYARINRPTGIVNFCQELKPEQVLDIWSGRLGEISELLLKISHLVVKEQMLSTR